MHTVIRYLLCNALTLALTATAGEPAPGTAGAPQPTLRIKRAALLVHDLEASIDFYTRVVGLELFDAEYRPGSETGSLSYPFFNLPADARRRWALFNTSDEIRGFAIEEASGFEWSVQQDPRTAVVLFETGDIRALEARLREAGHAVFSPADAEAYDTRFVELGFLDPDGHLLAAFQYSGD